MIVDAFGTVLRVERTRDAWRVWILGHDGARRPAADVPLPADPEDHESSAFSMTCSTSRPHRRNLECDCSPSSAPDACRDPLQRAGRFPLKRY